MNHHCPPFRIRLPAARLLGAVALAGLALSLAACAPRLRAEPATTGLRPALTGERLYLTLPGFGQVAYYADRRGQGRPLILTPSVNAAASAYEMKPLWDSYVGTRPVYALEWPGFGGSDRPDVRYTPALMTAALSALLAQTGEADVVSLSLGSEFAARAALEPGRVHSLALISPSGLGQPRGGSQQASQDEATARRAERLNRFGNVLYGAVRSRPSLRFFLSRSFRGPVPQDVVNYAYDTSHQPGARYAPLAFISGALFTPDAYGDLYSRLKTPTLVLYDKDAFVSFDRLPEFAAQPGVSAVRIAGTDGLPHFEKLPEVRAALDAFWASLP